MNEFVKSTLATAKRSAMMRYLLANAGTNLIGAAGLFFVLVYIRLLIGRNVNSLGDFALVGLLVQLSDPVSKIATMLLVVGLLLVGAIFLVWRNHSSRNVAVVLTSLIALFVFPWGTMLGLLTLVSMAGSEVDSVQIEP